MGSIAVRWQTCEVYSTVVSILLFHIILFAFPWFSQLKGAWFSVISVVCYSWWLWLENHWNHANLKMCNTTQTKEHGRSQPFSQSFLGYSVPLLVCKAEKFFLQTVCCSHARYILYKESKICLCMTSGFCCSVNEVFTLQECYAALIGS